MSLLPAAVILLPDSPNPSSDLAKSLALQIRRHPRCSAVTSTQRQPMETELDHIYLSASNLPLWLLWHERRPICGGSISQMVRLHAQMDRAFY